MYSLRTVLIKYTHYSLRHPAIVTGYTKFFKELGIINIRVLFHRKTADIPFHHIQQLARVI